MMELRAMLVVRLLRVDQWWTSADRKKTLH